MGPSAQCTSEPQTEMIQNEKTTNNSAGEVQERVEDGQEVFNLVNSSSVLSTVHNTFNIELEQKCLYEGVRLLNSHTIC